MSVEAPVRARAWLLGLSALAGGLALATLVTVARRVVFPYDFITWPDDYVLHELVKLRLGAPIYGSYEQTNSFIYAPGGVLLHRLLLAPFGLDLSIVANRVLSQVWLTLAVLLGVRVVGMISDRRAAHGALSAAAVLGAGATLTLAGYSNAVLDSLHPAALELLGLAIAATAAARWPSLSLGARVTTALVIPAGALLVKQTGASMGVALAAIAVATRAGGRRERLGCAAVSLASPVLAFLSLEVATRGGFSRWGLLLPLRQPLMWHHMSSLFSCAAAIAPLLVLVASGVGRGAAGDDTETHRAWLRVLALPLAYLPLTVPAFLKAGGGAFDFAALAFLFALLALAQVRSALSGVKGALPHTAAGLIAALQLLLWAPYRRAPSESNRAVAAELCAHVAEALGCGERILVDVGTTCLVRGGVTEVPRDRLFSMMELTWAGLQAEVGTTRRIAAEDYDVLALHTVFPPWPWPPATLVAIAEHYAAYASIPPAAAPSVPEFDLNDKARFDDWQGLDAAVVFFERKREAGRHRSVIHGPARCERGARAKARDE